ncbi:hypothetical protein FRC07_010766 [Ceratobasidium sp. 392]|nr:hypothetical protein FRC07_010766 [Ceratobasidium sp. 392]
MTTDIPSSIQAWRLPVDETLWVDHHSLQLRDVEISPPGEGEVLVKLHATSLNYRVGDILIAKKLYGLASYSSGPDGQGHILTSDGAGEVVAVGPGVADNEKAETYKSIVGVDEVLNYREAPEWSEEARKLTDGKGVEHILEVGGQTTFSQSLKAAQIGGHVHIIGTVGGFEGTGINFGEFSFGVMINRLHLHGQSVGSTEMFQRMVEFMERHKVKPVIGKVFEWDQAVEALDYAAAGAHFGKVVIKIPVFPANVLIRIPSYLTYEEAATLPCAGVTAWASLFETAVARPLGSGSTVLVQGSGGVSVLGAQLAKVAGARVIATTSSAEKIETYKSIVGADDVVNYRETPGWSEEVLKLTDGKGVEHILEVGGQTTLSQSLKAAQVGGHIHILGTVGGFEQTGINFGEFSLALILGRLNLHGQAVGSKEMFQRLVDFMEKHKVKPVVGKVFGWNQAVEALDYTAAGAHFGKVVIKIS